MSKKYTRGGAESNRANGTTQDETFRRARPANDAPASDVQCVLDVFEGRRMPRVFVRGEWLFPARAVGRLIEQEDDGKRFVRNVTEEGVEGTDYIVVAGAELAAVRGALRGSEGADSAPSHKRGAFSDGSGRGMVLLAEPGLYLALLHSRKAVGKRLRLWLAREVIPSIRKTGAYAAPKAVDPEVQELRARVAVLEAGGANGGVVGERFAYLAFVKPLKYAAGLLSMVRGKSLKSTYRSLRNRFERETDYSQRGQQWWAFPADPERVSAALALVRRLEQDAEREHRAWVDARPSRQGSLFAA